MSDRKMTAAHVHALHLADTADYAYQPFLREIRALVQALASGELRCADTRTEVVVSREEIEEVWAAVEGIRVREDGTSAMDILSGWLSTPDLPQK